MENARLLDEETYGISELEKVSEGKRPTQTTIIEAKKTIGKILASISNTIPNIGHYGYTFIIYSPQEWVALGNALQVIPPLDPPVFGGGNAAARYLHETQKIIFQAYKRHKDTTVRRILHIFGTVVFLALTDNHGLIVRHTQRQLITHLERTCVTLKQQRNDITAMDLKMRQPYSMDQMIKSYFMGMTSARWIQIEQLNWRRN